ncbi:MAG: hypothetical protein ACJ8D5_06555 [Sphingomicrobium sp.]
MRASILLAGAALALAACGNNDQSDNTTNVDENLAAENIVANDVTAIDAVTGDAANMAADVDINFTNDMLDSGGNAATTTNRSGSSSAPARTAARPSTPAPPPARGEPVANTSANLSE